MEDVILYELSALGFGPFFEQQLQSSDGDKVIPARIAAEHRGAYEVWSTTGSGSARLAGRLRLELEDAACPGGGLMLDTPGMRELQLVDDDGLGSVFVDIAALADRCRFRDCRHDTEPGCAVKAAVESGELDSERFEHYRKLDREAQAYELRHDVRKRRQAEKVWGQLSDEVAQLRKWKGGKP